MKIIFIRHGHPNYTDDCLTELGHKQAAAAAERLKDAKIDAFYSSSCGRAYETACYVAARHGKDVEKLDFMREINWGSPNTDDYVQPWWLIDRWIKDGKEIMNLDWQNDADYKGHILVESYNKVARGMDSWLAELGFVRDGAYYRVVRENHDTVLLASHGGSSSVVLSHIFNLPFSFVCQAILPDFTAITVVTLDADVGSLASPRFELVNDCAHIKSAEDKVHYDK